jgi:DNA-binding response OmpR family regulator
MNILVVEDNFLAAETLRMAVEDADFNVIGPAKSVEEGCRLVASGQIDGALLDIQLGGTQSFPLARLLRSNGVPFLFVTGYDASVLPPDLEGSPLIGKPVFQSEITRVATETFTVRQPAQQSVQPGDRVASLRERIKSTESRVATQQQRVQRLQFQGVDPVGVQLAADLLEQMRTSAELMHARLRLLTDTSGTEALNRVDNTIDDEIVDLGEPRSVEYWSGRLGIPIARLLEIGQEVGPSARAIARAVGRQRHTDGRPQKSH